MDGTAGSSGVFGWCWNGHDMSWCGHNVGVSQNMSWSGHNMRVSQNVWGGNDMRVVIGGMIGRVDNWMRNMVR